MIKNSFPLPAKYPKKIYVGMEIYRVIFTDKINCFGETDPEKRTIKLKKGMSPRSTLTTFIHELLHAIEFESDIKIKHKQIYELEAGIFELLVDNFI